MLAPHGGDALVDLLGCSSWLSIEVTLDQTVLVENAAAAAHVGAAPLKLRQLSLNGGELRQFAFGPDAVPS